MKLHSMISLASSAMSKYYILRVLFGLADRYGNVSIQEMVVFVFMVEFLAVWVGAWLSDYELGKRSPFPDRSIAWYTIIFFHFMFYLVFSSTQLILYSGLNFVSKMAALKPNRKISYSFAYFLLFTGSLFVTTPFFTHTFMETDHLVWGLTVYFLATFVMEMFMTFRASLFNISNQ